MLAFPAKLFLRKTDMRYQINAIEDMQRLLLGRRETMGFWTFTSSPLAVWPSVNLQLNLDPLVEQTSYRHEFAKRNKVGRGLARLAG
jgi:hypothetical protein